MSNLVLPGHVRNQQFEDRKKAQMQALAALKVDNGLQNQVTDLSKILESVVGQDNWMIALLRDETFVRVLNTILAQLAPQMVTRIVSSDRQQVIGALRQIYKQHVNKTRARSESIDLNGYEQVLGDVQSVMAQLPSPQTPMFVQQLPSQPEPDNSSSQEGDEKASGPGSPREEEATKVEDTNATQEN